MEWPLTHFIKIQNSDATYADLIRSGRKTWEGRANAGWLTKVSANDSITFKVTTRDPERLVVHALEVCKFDTFEEMLTSCGLDACLPGCATVAAGVAIYRSFYCFGGESYADMEAEHGVVAIPKSSRAPAYSPVTGAA